MLAVAMLALAVGSFTVFAAAVTPVSPPLQPPASNQGRRLLLVPPTNIPTHEMLDRLEAAKAIEGKELVFRYRLETIPPGIKMTITRPESVEESLSAAPVLNYFTAQKFMQGANLAKHSSLNLSAVNALKTVQLIESADMAEETIFDTIVRTVGDQVKVRVVRKFREKETILESQIDVPPIFDVTQYNSSVDKLFWKFLNCEVNNKTGEVAWNNKEEFNKYEIKTNMEPLVVYGGHIQHDERPSVFDSKGRYWGSPRVFNKNDFDFKNETTRKYTAQMKEAKQAFEAFTADIPNAEDLMVKVVYDDSENGEKPGLYIDNPRWNDIDGSGNHVLYFNKNEIEQIAKGQGDFSDMKKMLKTSMAHVEEIEYAPNWQTGKLRLFNKINKKEILPNHLITGRFENEFEQPEVLLNKISNALVMWTMVKSDGADPKVTLSINTELTKPTLVISNGKETFPVSIDNFLAVAAVVHPESTLAFETLKLMNKTLLLDPRKFPQDTTPDPPCRFHVEAPVKPGDACSVFMKPYTPGNSPSPPFAVRVDPEAVEKASKSNDRVGFFDDLRPDFGKMSFDHFDYSQPGNKIFPLFRLLNFVKDRFFFLLSLQ
eukprot:GHVT01012587.1.p1 GENE.GHVT01012587.1~~GHVT01012587.1.p1  ORF type:complete len:601 (+),score=79.95 GHVT01012587.1:849-2651(+)